MVIARNSGLAVHHVTVHDLGEKLTVSIDLEVDGEMTLTAAHDIAHGLERNIRDEFGEDVEVDTHIEPLEPELPHGTDATPERVEAIRAGRTLASPAPATAKDRRRVQVRGLFDRWGGYLIGLLVIAMIFTSGRLGFQGAVLMVLGVAIATVLFRETFVRLPIAAGPLTPGR